LAVPPGKTQIALRVDDDDDVSAWFKNQAEINGRWACLPLEFRFYLM
jgi:hypothetical protein